MATTALNNTLFNAMLDAAAGSAVSLSLHSTDNGDTPPAAGADEVSTARQTVTWNPASGGLVTVSGDVTWDVPGSTTVNWCGFWTAGGAWLGAIKLSAPEQFGAPGQYVATVVSLNQANAA
jgi:hypothetical protein